MTLHHKRKARRKQTAEDFTPPILVNEMLDKLPQEIWSDPNKKFCDPCMGTGKYLLGIKKRLMDNLPSNVDGKYNSNEKEKYIVENMLWGVDIAKGKTSIAKKLINNKGYKDNLLNKDSLNLDWNKMPKFDVVVGNPPYQAPQSAGGGLGGSQRKIYEDFVKSSISILKPNGLMVFIHPGNWRSGMSKITKSIGNLLRDKIRYLNINTAKKYFNLGTSFDWYLLINSSNSGDTIIETEDGIVNLNLHKYKIIPNKLNETVISILEKTIYSDKSKLNLEMTDERIKGESKIQTNEYKYPLMQAGEKNKDIRWYGREKHPLQDKYKVFISAISDGGHIYIGKDYGTAGIWQNLVLICRNKNECDKYYDYFNSTFFRFIAKITNFNRFFNYTLVFSKLIPDISIDSNHLTDDQIFNYFKLSKEEINYIKSQI